MRRSASPRAEWWPLLLVGATLLIDTTFYSALTPLLPRFAHRLHLTSLSAGVLSASYAVGCLGGTLPASRLVARRGPRPAMILGLSLLSVATIAFALLSSEVALDASRLVEGVGGACSWSGALSWVAGTVAPERRGSRMALALACSTAGSLVGPVLGTVAAQIGRPTTFGVVAAMAALLAVGVAAGAGAGAAGAGSRAATPVGPAPGDPRAPVGVLAALRDRPVAFAVWLVALPAAASGSLTVLGSLRLHALGAGTVWIGATFLIAAVIEAGLGPLVGWVSDRRGRMMPLRVGLVAVGVWMALFTVPAAPATMSALVIAIVLSLTAVFAPAMANVSEVVERRGRPIALTGGLINLAWAGGQTLGGIGSGSLATAAGDIAPTLVLCAVALTTAAVVMRSGGRRRPGWRGRSASAR